MSDRAMKLANKHLILSSVGLALQSVGSLCVMMGVIGFGKEVSNHTKKIIIRELSKQIPAE